MTESKIVTKVTTKTYKGKIVNESSLSSLARKRVAGGGGTNIIEGVVTKQTSDRQLDEQTRVATQEAAEKRQKEIEQREAVKVEAARKERDTQVKAIEQKIVSEQKPYSGVITKEVAQRGDVPGASVTSEARLRSLKDSLYGRTPGSSAIASKVIIPEPLEKAYSLQVEKRVKQYRKEQQEKIVGTPEYYDKIARERRENEQKELNKEIEEGRAKIVIKMFDEPKKPEPGVIDKLIIGTKDIYADIEKKAATELGSLYVGAYKLAKEKGLKEPALTKRASEELKKIQVNLPRVSLKTQELFTPIVNEFDRPTGTTFNQIARKYYDRFMNAAYPEEKIREFERSFTKETNTISDMIGLPKPGKKELRFLGKASSAPLRYVKEKPGEALLLAGAAGALSYYTLPVAVTTTLSRAGIGLGAAYVGSTAYNIYREPDYGKKGQIFGTAVTQLGIAGLGGLAGSGLKQYNYEKIVSEYAKEAKIKSKELADIDIVRGGPEGKQVAYVKQDIDVEVGGRLYRVTGSGNLVASKSKILPKGQDVGGELNLEVFGPLKKSLFTGKIKPVKPIKVSVDIKGVGKGETTLIGSTTKIKGYPNVRQLTTTNISEVLAEEGRKTYIFRKFTSSQGSKISEDISFNLKDLTFNLGKIKGKGINLERIGAGVIKETYVGPASEVGYEFVQAKAFSKGFTVGQQPRFKKLYITDKGLTPKAPFAPKPGQVKSGVTYTVKGNKVNIEFIGTTPTERGKGLGSSLLKTIESTEPGKKMVAKGVIPGSEGFYQKQGFEQVAKHTFVKPGETTALPAGVSEVKSASIRAASEAFVGKPTTKFILFPGSTKTETESETKRKVREDVKIKTETKQDVFYKPVFDYVSEPIVDTRRITPTAVVFDVVTTTEQKTNIRQLQVPASVVETKQDNLLYRPLNIPQPPQIPNVTMPGLIEFPDVSSPKGERLVDLYDVQVKEKGVYKKVNSKALPANKALNLGADVVDNTPSATFRLKRTGRRADEKDDFFFSLSNKFTKKNGNYIERESSRIDTEGERTGITVKGLLELRKRQSGSIFF